MAQIRWTEDDLERVERIGRAAGPGLMDALPGDQRRAVQARVLDELEYGEIARRTGTSEQVVRKRVSRGLATMRRRLTGGSS
jgi:RNA polymerase sigma-70 factor (ECF subfamily)